jgi:hypothetical protein
MLNRSHNIRRAMAVLVVMGLLVIQPVAAAGTTVTQTITPGLLTLTSQPSATLTSVPVDSVHNQTTQGSLGAVQVTDNRGSAAGWSATATVSNFTKVDTPTRLAGSAGGITLGGTYTGSGYTFTLTITKAGDIGTAQFGVEGISDTQTITATDTPISTTGLTVRFAPGNYQVGDQWTWNAAAIPASDLTISPSTINAMVGSYAGVQPGAVHTLSSNTDVATIMNAAAGGGMGWYIDTPSLSLLVPVGTRSGSYTATVTETVN